MKPVNLFSLITHAKFTNHARGFDPIDFFVLFTLDVSEVDEVKNEGCSFSKLALNINFALHQSHKPLADGKSQASSIFVDVSVLLKHAEVLEQVFQSLFAYSCPLVDNFDPVGDLEHLINVFKRVRATSFSS